MKQIFVIGTLHAGLTPKKELIKVLIQYNPDQLLVEIVEQDLISGNLTSYPEEMVHAYHWAKSKGIDVKGFDSPINTFKSGKAESDNQKVIEEQKKLLKNLGWKDMNKKENSQLLNTDSLKQLIDLQKEENRRIQMLRNIKKLMMPVGKVVILTGTNHLDFLEKQFPEATFPYR